MSSKQRLGRGLDALIKDDAPAAGPAAPEAAAPSQPGREGVRMVLVGDIRRNPRQPRHEFAPEAIQELADSIREHGVLQPLSVRLVGGAFELIAGERRLMAARQAGLKEVPVIVREAADAETLELALIENLQREDLNPIEEAEGYKRLADEFGLTQEEIARRVGKARASVANALRLLDLPEDVRLLLAGNKIQTGHAKVLLGVELDAERSMLAKRVVAEDISVRELERIVARLKRLPRKSRQHKVDIPPEHLQFLSDKLHQHFGTAVRLIPCKTLANGRKVKGTLEVDFHSNDELTRILEIIGLTDIG